MKQKISEFFREFRILLGSLPPLTFSLFLLSVFSMNLLANKSLNIPLDWLALDCGIVVSWVSFLCMDVFTKHYGPKAATLISLFALLINLGACLIFFIASVIPGTWGAFFDYGEPVVNDALDHTFGGTWYVLMGSAVAFATSSAVNNFANFGIGKLFRNHPDGFAAFACRTYLSTAIGQFCDNLVFALIVSHFFFGWTILQCITCAITGMVAELLIEAVFSPIGYRVQLRWKARGVGKEYFEACKKQPLKACGEDEI